MLGLLRGGANLVANLLQDVLRCVFGPLEILLQTCCFLLLDVLRFPRIGIFFLGSWISWLSDGGTQKTPAVWKCDGKRFSKLLDHGDVFVC